MGDHRNTLRAFTLIELMASIALLALIASICAIGLASTGDAAATERAIAAVLDADRSARQIANESGPVRLTVTDGHTRLTLALVVEESGVQEIDLPPGILVDLLSSDAELPLQAVAYDGRGRCTDFRVRVRSGERMRALQIAGLTGWAEQLGSPIR